MISTCQSLSQMLLIEARRTRAPLRLPGTSGEQAVGLPGVRYRADACGTDRSNRDPEERARGLAHAYTGAGRAPDSVLTGIGQCQGPCTLGTHISTGEGDRTWTNTPTGRWFVYEEKRWRRDRQVGRGRVW